MKSTIRELLEDDNDGGFKVEYEQRHIKTGYRVVHNIEDSALSRQLKGARVHNFIPQADSQYAGLTIYRNDKGLWSAIVYRKIGNWKRGSQTIEQDLRHSFPQLPPTFAAALALRLLTTQEGIIGPVVKCSRFNYRNVLLLGDAAHAITNGLG